MSESESRQPLKFSRPPAGRRAETPLWMKWVLSLGVVVVLLVALIIYVDHNNTDDSNGQPLSAKAVEEQNQEATILQQQDQTPVVFRLSAGAVAVHAVKHAVHIDMNERINENEAGPPLKAATCHTTTAAGARQGFSCKVLSGGVYFDFVAVVDAPARQLILCKRDPPPIPSEVVPVSSRCRP